jgi:UDP-N-acetylmuramoylalanine-D-glutamate ligase
LFKKSRPPTLQVPKLDQLSQESQDDLIAVLGCGISGLSSLQLLHHKGCKNLLAFDQKLLDLQFKKKLEIAGLPHIPLVRSPEELIDKAPKIAVVSPGLPLASEWIQSLQQKG